jgi:hypothetical protein
MAILNNLRPFGILNGRLVYLHAGHLAYFSLYWYVENEKKSGNIVLKNRVAGKFKSG